MTHPRKDKIDLGLLVLRFIALFLLVTIGWQKLWDLVVAVHTGKPLATIGVAPLLGKMGFPLPTVTAVSVALIESIASLLIAAGFYTRLFALFATCSMAGAFYTSAHFGWEPIRSFIYLFVFLALVFTGAGTFSLDFRLSPGALFEHRFADIGLLLLRIGLATSMVLLATMRSAKGPASFAHGPGGILLALGLVLAAPVVLGCFTRIAAITSAIFWMVTVVSGFAAGQRWDLAPYRGILFVFVFVTLSLTGPGRFSVRRQASH